MDPIKRLAVLLLVYYGNSGEMSEAHIEQEAMRLFGANANMVIAAFALMEAEGYVIRSEVSSSIVSFSLPECLLNMVM